MGRGQSLGGLRRRNGLFGRAANILGAAATVGAPLAGALMGRSHLKRKFGSLQKARDDNVEPFGITGPGSQHNFTFKGRPKSKSKAVASPPLRYVVNHQGSIANAEGKQEYGNIVSLYSQAELTAMWQFAGAGTVTAERLLHHRKVHGMAMLANSTAQTLRVSIYYIEPKRDTNNVTANFPDNLIEAAYADLLTSGVAGTASNYKIIGTDPTDLEAFNKYFRIVDTQDLLVEAGQIHFERFDFSVNKSLDSELTKYTNGLKDFQRHILVRVHGTPEFATAAVGTTSTTKGRLSYSVAYTYDYAVVDQSVLQMQFVDNMAALTNPLFEQHVPVASVAPTV